MTRELSRPTTLPGLPLTRREEAGRDLSESEIIITPWALLGEASRRRAKRCNTSYIEEWEGRLMVAKIATSSGCNMIGHLLFLLSFRPNDFT